MDPHIANVHRRERDPAATTSNSATTQTMAAMRVRGDEGRCGDAL